MLRPSTITVATIAVCGVTLALGGSVGLQPRFVHPVATVAPVVHTAPPATSASRHIPHKFMRAPPARSEVFCQLREYQPAPSPRHGGAMLHTGQTVPLKVGGKSGDLRGCRPAPA